MLKRRWKFYSRMVSVSIGEDWIQIIIYSYALNLSLTMLWWNKAHYSFEMVTWMATSSNQRCLIQRSTIYCIKICLCHWLVGSLNLRDFLNKNSIKEQNIGSDAELKLLKYVISQRNQRFNILFKTSTVLLILIKIFFKSSTYLCR